MPMWICLCGYVQVKVADEVVAVFRFQVPVNLGGEPESVNLLNLQMPTRTHIKV